MWVYQVSGQVMCLQGRTSEIPNGGMVSRHIWPPAMGEDFDKLIYHNVFQFAKEYGSCESLVWRKFAPHIGCVHAIGCYAQLKQPKHRKRYYSGAISAEVDAVRNFKSKRGHGFKIIHEPSEGIHHVHITLDKSPDVEFNKGDRSELLIALMTVLFKDQSEHSCT